MTRQVVHFEPHLRVSSDEAEEAVGVTGTHYSTNPGLGP
jgi:hypothetical protein